MACLPVWAEKLFESCHEIMVLFVLRKLILQTCMPSHPWPMGLDVWYSVWSFVYIHTSCVRKTNALARLRGCAGSPEPSLVAYVISTMTSCAGTFKSQQLNLLVNRIDIRWKSNDKEPIQSNSTSCSRYQTGKKHTQLRQHKIKQHTRKAKRTALSQ